MSRQGGWPEVITGIATLGGVLGLRWLTHRQPAPDLDRDVLLTTSDVLISITTSDHAFFDQALYMAHEVHQEEVASRNAVETKAGILMSTLGITASLIVAGGSLIFTSRAPLGDTGMLLGIVAACLLVSTILLIAAIYHGFRALAVGDVARPSACTFLIVQACEGDQLTELKRHQLADLLVSHRRNQQANNLKAAHLNEGYRWGLSAAVLLLITGAVITGHALWAIAGDAIAGL